MAEQNKNNPGNAGTANPNKPTQNQDMPGEQPGTQRQGAERTQMGGQEPGKSTLNTGNADRKDEHQPGTKRQGAESTQMGERQSSANTGNTPAEAMRKQPEAASTRANMRDEAEEGNKPGVNEEDDDTTKGNQAPRA